MSEWKEYKLGDIVAFGNGKVRPKVLGEIPVYGGNGILDYCNTHNYSEETVVIGRVGAYCGSVYYENKPIWVSDNALAAKPQNGYNAKFLYYYLTNLSLNEFAEGSSHPLVTQTLLNSIDVRITSDIAEQERIAGVLSSLDDKIDLLNRQNTTLEAMAETLFRQYFIENPKEDWKDGKLGDLIDIRSGYAYKGEYIGCGNSLLLGMGCVSYNVRFLNNGARLYAGDCPSGYLSNAGDIVVATRQQSDNMPILGAPAIIPHDLNDRNIIVGTNLYRVKNKSSLSNYCIYLLMRSDDYRNHIDACSKGSTVKMITKDSIESFPIMIPSDDYIAEHQDCFNIIDKKVINNNYQTHSLTKLRDTLLPKLMNNEIKL